MFSQLFAALSGTAPQAEEIKAKIEQGALLIDVRSPAEFSAERAHGAQNIPLETVPQFAQNLQDKSQAIVVHCRSGARANQAVQFLKSQGFSDVINAGGLEQIRAIVG